MVSVNRNIAGYNKYLLVITVVVVLSVIVTVIIPPYCSMERGT